MHHSRAAALLVGDYADRVQQLLYGASVADGTALVVVATYTVGANISALIESTFLSIGATAAANTAQIEILARGFYLDVIYSLVANANSRPFAPHVLLTAGQTAQIRVQNLSGAANLMLAIVNAREVDL